MVQEPYMRGKLPLLPHEQIDPDLVRRAAKIAKALLDDQLVFEDHSGYSRRTVHEVLNGSEQTSSRVRSDLMRYSRQIAQEQKQSFFDLASVEPIDLPDAVYPYRIVRTRIVAPEDFLFNRENPFDTGAFRDSLRHHLWNLLYLSVRPANSSHIHLYGRPLLKCRAFMGQMTEPTTQAYLETMLNGPDGRVNANSVVANPTILDYFASRLNNLTHNIWGNSLQQGGADIDADLMQP